MGSCLVTNPFLSWEILTTFNLTEKRIFLLSLKVFAVLSTCNYFIQPTMNTLVLEGRNNMFVLNLVDTPGLWFV